MLGDIRSRSLFSGASLAFWNRSAVAAGNYALDRRLSRWLTSTMVSRCYASPTGAVFGDSETAGERVEDGTARAGPISTRTRRQSVRAVSCGPDAKTLDSGHLGLNRGSVQRRCSGGYESEPHAGFHRLAARGAACQPTRPQRL
jgi:hypothetical protein